SMMRKAGGLGSGGDGNPGEVPATVASRHRRTVEMARRERDRSRSVRTIPARSRPIRWDVAPPALLPAVDPATWALHVRLSAGDTAAREELVAHYEGHARSLARRFFRHREPLEDLVQVSLEALLLALD